MVQRFFPGETVTRLSIVFGVGFALFVATGCGPSANPRDSARPAAQPALGDSGELKAPKTIYDGVNIPPEGPRVRLKDDSGTAVEVVGCDAKELAALEERKLKPDEWPGVFALYVEREGKDTKDQSSVLGTYQITDGVIRFEPRYPLVRGVRYKAVYNRPDVNPVVAHLLIPKPKLPATVVEQVYPTRDALPENQLRFYLHFSAPMSRGEAYDRIQLLDDDAKPVIKPFLTLEQELWDTDGKRFTLFLDPGRIKRGLKPREELGPALIEGKRYSLVIDSGWNDGNGEPLKETYRKTFKVLAPDDTQPDPKTWKLDAPAANGSAPLTVTFPKSMDSALAARMVWVEDGDGKKVAGTAALFNNETGWQLKPTLAWRAGKYNLVADTRLEDLAGNSIAKPFEIDVFHPIQREIKTETVKVPFEVK
jgi:hypothetical protein